MTVLMVPPLDEEPYPTLGPQVCDFIETFLVHGPGDLRGQSARLDDEKRALIYRMYEVFPEDHPQAGRRRFRRVGLSLRKGSAKTELAAWIAACELHPDGPVRCDGFDGRGNPIARGVVDPYIPMVAFTAEQADDLAYAALRVALEEGPLARDFDIGLERIMRRGGDGKAEALSSSPSSRDGARTSFQHADETHRWILPRLKQAHQTMLANLPKRLAADPWALETTTAPAPGEGSVAEGTYHYAQQVESGAVKDSRLFFFHRQASDDHDLSTREGVRAAVLEASGPVASWSNIDAIVDQFQEPDADRDFLERVWLNRLVRHAQRAFDVARFRELGVQYDVPPDGDKIVLGFDGSRYHDATAIIATHIETGYQWVVGLWERPENLDEWEVPEPEVTAAVGEAFHRWDVWRMYADPPYWETQIAEWAGEYGAERVVEWRTNRKAAMAYATSAYATAIAAGQVGHNGDRRLLAHVGNACRQYVNLWDDQDKEDQGKRLWVMTKDRSDSPRKIDAAIAAALSWEARRDALTEGVANEGPSIYEDRGFLVWD